MDQTTAQNPANPGASNAADFQPGTQNPQAAPAQLFNQPSGVQSGAQDSLLENKDARISVSSQPAAAAPAVTQAKGGNGEVVFAILVAAVIALWLMWRRRKQQRPVNEANPIVELPEEVVVEEKTAVAPVVAKTPQPKKPAPKKSKSQRKKRSRR